MNRDDPTVRDAQPAQSVLILWADHSSANLGVQALAAGATALVMSAWPGATIEYYQHNDLTGRQPVRLGFANLGFAYVWPRHAIRRWLASYGAIIDMGAGDSFTDIYGWRRMLSMSLLRLVAGCSTDRLVLGPQTIGPFRHGFSRRLSRFSLRRTKLIIARDSASRAYARTALGIEPRLGTDVVFAVSIPDSVPARFDIVFNVSGLLWNSDDQTNAARYQAACLELCRSLRAKGRRFSLLVHVQSNASLDDDSVACRELAELLGDRVEVLVPRDLADVRAILGGANVVIAARMHACLNAISVGVPAIAWAYSRKFEPLLADLGWNAVVDVTSPRLVDTTLGLVAELDRHGGSMVALTLAQARTRIVSTQNLLTAALAARP